jgi:uncharacterized membrane protein YjjB (DUF3815 family)
MIVVFSAPLCALFFYLALKLYRIKNYQACLVMGGLGVMFLVLTLGCVGLGYLWATYPGEISL